LLGIREESYYSMDGVLTHYLKFSIAWVWVLLPIFRRHMQTSSLLSKSTPKMEAICSRAYETSITLFKA
jgi:hypothetical protein